MVFDLLPGRLSKRGENKSGPRLIYWRARIETALWKKKMQVGRQILIEQLLCLRPVLAQGVLVNGYTKSLPLYTDIQSVNKGRRYLHIVLSPRKAVTG